jgi:putative transposase
MDRTCQRRSIRLRDHDYRAAGAYFVTICSFQRECLFGQVVDGVVRLTPYGEIVRDEWEKSASVRHNVIVDEYIVMPNHLHGIIFIVHDDGTRDGHPASDHVGAHRCAPGIYDGGIAGHDRAHVGACDRAHVSAPLRRRQPGSVGSIIAGFKSAVTKRINMVRSNPGCPVWQRNYYERVVRTETELANIRQYITENPLRWDQDENNPINGGKCP